MLWLTSWLLELFFPWKGICFGINLCHIFFPLEYEEHLNERKRKFLHTQKRKSIFTDENLENKEQSTQDSKVVCLCSF